MTTPEQLSDQVQYKVTLLLDDFPHDAPDAAGLFQLHSFSTRHTAFTDPREVLACVECGDVREEFLHTDVEFTNDGDMVWADWATEFRADPDNAEDLHTFQLREGYVLSYFEHDQCVWSLAGHGPRDPWDSVDFAGFLEVTPDKDNEDWWRQLSAEEREEVAGSFLEEYTNWANGDIWGYAIERISPPIQCDQGFTHTTEETVDSCFGFIGSDWFLEAVKEALPDDATEDNTEVEDQYGVASYTDLFDREEVRA